MRHKNKSGNWTDDDFGTWLTDGVTGREIEIGTHKGKAIESHTVVDGDSSKVCSVEIPTEYSSPRLGIVAFYH